MNGSVESEVAAAYRDWDEAFNKADADAVSRAYATDATLLPPTHSVVTGSAEIRDFFSGLFGNGVSAHKLEIIEAGGDGSLLYGAAKWSAKAKSADGGMQDLGGIATHIFQRQADGTLKLKLHTFN